MLYSGLCSVTFRKLSPEQVVELSARAALAGIEWGGDVHVPHGQVDVARRVRDLTAGAGLACPSYGSYYKLAESEPAGLAFAAVLDSAVALGARTIRVWSGNRHSRDADAAYRKVVEDDARRIGQLAGRHGITISCEFHQKSLTDTPESTAALMKATADAGLRTYWQPPLKMAPAERLAGLRAVLPWLTHLHVEAYSEGDEPQQVALAEGEGPWLDALRLTASIGGNRYCYLEFVPGGTPDSFLRDAGTLIAWLQRINKE